VLESVAGISLLVKEKGMNRFALIPFFLLFIAIRLPASEFTVLVYNVENLFDVDGVALFGDYRQGAEGDYGPGPLINKLEGIRTTLAAVNNGTGPEIILFQELELDRTPYDTPSAAAFLAETEGQDLLSVMENNRNLPSELLLLKYLDDHGLTGYHIAQPDPVKAESHPPHKNVVFSRFPVTFVRQRDSLDARDLLVVGLSVDGHELIVLNNHWKSGASDARTEPIRVQNALVVRAEIEAILFRNPQADVIIAGDLNSYYNHSAAFPDLPETGVNDILGANGFESRMIEPGSANLYNLWFEKPLAERGSEVWRGKWGTLMQMILTPGLYDRRGIQYIDNSFDRLVLPGVNVDNRWGRPIAWTNYGGGAGFSDHLPIFARFRVVEGDGEAGFMELQDPTNEELPAERPVVHFERMNRRAVPPADFLAGMSPAERVRQVGELFHIDAQLVASKPARIRVGDLEMEIYSPIRAVRDSLDTLEPGDSIRAYGDLDVFRGKLQLVIRDPGWLFQTGP
jgi:endonuclease/exonuclease/phosphatase family metal-dependent hydrolase